MDTTQPDPLDETELLPRAATGDTVALAALFARHRKRLRQMVRQPYLNAFQYRFALLQAEHACRQASDQQEYRIGLGAAFYRDGCYRNAIETLKRADRPDQSSSAALAFLAMAHHRLGEREQARAAVSRLRELLQKTDPAQREVARAFLPEVEAIEPGLTFSIDPFVR
jgi:Flp pilus assembly protein TadD